MPAPPTPKTRRTMTSAPGRSRERPDLMERAVIEQRRQALTYREPARLMLTPDLVRAAHPLGQVPPAAHVIKFRLPRHTHRS
jgi:hypothetical protein